MPPRFDAENLTLRLSIADLLEGPLRRHLGFASRGGYERLWLGQAIHSRYQEQALAEDPTYRREEWLSCDFEHRGWRVTLEGRADGLRRDADGALVVEEIKSVRGGGPAPAVIETYRQQALLYCWVLHRLGEERVRAELVLIEIGRGQAEREPLEPDFEALETAVRRRLTTLLREFQSERQARLARQEASTGLAFPYPSLRPGQPQIIEAVERALAHREHLLLEAATGIGKTAAALFPSLRFALAHDKRLFVLTAKTLQQRMALTVLELLNPEDRFRSLQLRAKAKMCANDQVLCHEEYCPYARDYALKLQRSSIVARLLAAHGTLLPDEIFAAACSAEVCPFEVSLELASSVQVIVGDYNYAFAPYVALSDFAAESDLSGAILVIDEIHNLVDRGRGYYSPELAAAAPLRAAEERGRRGGEPLHRRIAGLCRELAAAIETAVGRGLEGEAAAAETALPEDDLWALRSEMDAAFLDYLEHQREAKSFRAEDPFVDLYFDFLRFLDVLAVSDDAAFSHCVERGDGQARMRILCKDPSRFLGAVLGRAHAVIGLSATLSPPEFYRDLLGFDRRRTVTVSIPNPFPRRHRRVVIDGSVATTWRARPDNYGPIGERLARFADEVPGNCLALFPSYEFLSRVAAGLTPRRKRVLVQSRADGDREREAILEALRSAVLGDVLLLAVAGGVFAEGVDYPGDTLKAVAVVGPCLPAVSLERELLQRYYQEGFERGFEYAFVVPGMTRVVQAAGRLIRSPEDTGVIALLDRRFLLEPYRRHLPADWLPEEGPSGLIGDPAGAAAEFFARPA